MLIMSIKVNFFKNEVNELREISNIFTKQYREDILKIELIQNHAACLSKCL